MKKKKDAKRKSKGKNRNSGDIYSDDISDFDFPCADSSNTKSGVLMDKNEG